MKDPITITLERESALAVLNLLRGRVAIPPGMHEPLMDAVTVIGQSITEPTSTSTADEPAKEADAQKGA